MLVVVSDQSIELSVDILKGLELLRVPSSSGDESSLVLYGCLFRKIWRWNREKNEQSIRFFVKVFLF